MFKQAHVAVNHKGYVIFHLHINGIFQCVDNQVILIGVVRIIQCIIKLQQPFLVSKQYPEYPVLIGMVYRRFLRHDIQSQFFIHIFFLLSYGREHTRPSFERLCLIPCFIQIINWVKSKDFKTDHVPVGTL